MNKLIIASLLLLSTSTSIAGEIGTDKYIHSVGMFVGTNLLRHAGLTQNQAALAMFGIGVLKEIIDSKRKNGTGFSGEDLIANSVGIGLSCHIQF